MWNAEKIYFQGSSGYTRAYQGDELVWDSFLANTLKFTAKANNTTAGLKKKASYQTVEYSTNGVSWSTMTTATTINMSSGDTVYIRGTLTRNITSSNYTNFKFTGNVAISGNINYLWNYQAPDTALKNYCGYFLFSDCTAITDASELRFPATTLAQSCYMTMFQNCSGLTSVPSILPATTLADSCYRGMFQYTPITTAPELPATTLSTYCYQNMFRGCGHLNYIKCLATNISATNSTTNWVSNVAATGTFVKASSMTGWTVDSVNGIPIGWTLYDDKQLQSISISGDSNVRIGVTYSVIYNPSDTTETGVTWSIVSGSEYATIDPNTGVLTAISGASGDTVVIRATSTVNPSIADDKTLNVTYAEVEAIKFTAKADNSNVVLRQKSSRHTVEYSLDGITWDEMKAGFVSGTIINLNSGETLYVRGDKSYDGSIIIKNDYSQFAIGGNVKVSGNIKYLFNYSNPSSKIRTWYSNSLFEDATGLTDASELVLPDIDLFTALGCYDSMFYRCSGLTTAPELPATKLVEECYRFMFYGCSSLTSAPVLPATTLPVRCYEGMFWGCSSLNYIKCLATIIPEYNDSTTNWVQDVAATGTFVKASSMTGWTRGNNGIPTGWTIENA